MSHFEIVTSFGFKNLDFIESKFIRNLLLDKTKTQFTRQQIVDSVIRSINQKRTGKAPIKISKSNTEFSSSEALYMVSRDEYPDDIEVVQEENKNKIVFMNEKNEYFLLEFFNTPPKASSRSLASSELQLIERKVEPEPEPEPEGEAELEGEAEPEPEGEGEAEGDAEPEPEGELEPEGDGEAEPEAEPEPEGEPEPELMMEITLHPNDQKNFSNLPVLKVVLNETEKEFRVGYSNILYTNNDEKKPFGLLLTPVIQGKEVEIYVFD